MWKKQHSKYICFGIMLIFIIGILGSVNTTTAASRKLCQLDLQSDKVYQNNDSDGMGRGRMPVDGQLLPVQSHERIDDFQIANGNCHSNPKMQERTRDVMLLLMAIILLCMMISLEQRPCYGEKPFCVFEVVSFIHRTDGKKKSCFAAKNETKQEVRKWKLEQNTKYYL